MQVLQIPSWFYRFGCRHRLKKKQPGAAIYEITVNCLCVGYEVHQLNFRALDPSMKKDLKYLRRHYTHIEELAKPAERGIFSWHFDTLQAAKDKFDSIVGNKREGTK